MTILMKRIREAANVEAEAMANCLMLLANVGKTSSPSSSSFIDLHPFECKTCNKRFPSFQALGGHRTSHKRQKLLSPAAGDMLHLYLEDGSSTTKMPKRHHCSICGLEFSTGQALGGHMRRHRAARMNGSVEKSFPVTAKTIPVFKRTNTSKRILGFELDLDLNTPAAHETDDLKLESTSPPPILRCFI